MKYDLCYVLLSHHFTGTKRDSRSFIWNSKILIINSMTSVHNSKLSNDIHNRVYDTIISGIISIIMWFPIFEG